jgi:hypothetical protein
MPSGPRMRTSAVHWAPSPLIPSHQPRPVTTLGRARQRHSCTSRHRPSEHSPGSRHCHSNSSPLTSIPRGPSPPPERAASAPSGPSPSPLSVSAAPPAPAPPSDPLLRHLSPRPLSPRPTLRLLGRNLLPTAELYRPALARRRKGSSFPSRALSDPPASCFWLQLWGLTDARARLPATAPTRNPGSAFALSAVTRSLRAGGVA